MKENRGKLLQYLLVLGVLFGLLYLMKFVLPHYETGDYSDTYPVDGTEYEESTTEAIPQVADQAFEESSDSLEGNQQPVQPAEEKKTESKEVTATGSDQYFTTLRRNYQNNVLSKLKPGKARTDVVIRYYKHPPDGEKVYALRDLGFYIHERPVEQSMTNYESNAIYYGDSVRKEDLLIVASTLINQGMPIKNIQPSQYHDGWKSNSIEIGADSTMIDKSRLTLEQLKNLQFKFL